MGKAWLRQGWAGRGEAEGIPVSPPLLLSHTGVPPIRQHAPEPSGSFSATPAGLTVRRATTWHSERGLSCARVFLRLWSLNPSVLGDIWGPTPDTQCHSSPFSLGSGNQLMQNLVPMATHWRLVQAADRGSPAHARAHTHTLTHTHSVPSFCQCTHLKTVFQFPSN